ISGVSSTVCNEDETRCTWEEVACSPDGRCRQQVLECVSEPCPAVASSDPRGDEFSWTDSSTECGKDACMSVTEYCSGSECEREIRKCDVRRQSASTKIWSNGTYATCSVVSESGSLSLSEYEYVENSALGFTVLYLTQATDVPRVGWLERGYHLLETVQPSDEQWIERIQCEHDAKTAALNDYNQLHGTNYDREGGYEEEVAEALEPEIERLQTLCPPGVTIRRVDAPVADTLTLRVGKQPQSGS
ncbi:MAG TPA: hypothetical protein VIM73_21735, partial [Polyangiaceae bacterium]